MDQASKYTEEVLDEPLFDERWLIPPTLLIEAGEPFSDEPSTRLDLSGESCPYSTILPSGILLRAMSLRNRVVNITPKYIFNFVHYMNERLTSALRLAAKEPLLQ